MSDSRLIPLALTLALAGGALAAAPVASAKGGDPGVRVGGVCGKGSTAKLKVKGDDGRIEVEFEVDQNRAGVPWKVTIRRGSALVVSTRATTHAPSGSFSVERKVAGPHGTIVAVATRAGERCSATAAV
jgi:hypothetical protein